MSAASLPIQATNLSTQTASTPDPSPQSDSPATIVKMFFTVDEAAIRLGVKPGWIYERTRRKMIPHRKLGKFVRFTEADLQTISEASARGVLQ
jgi:excisionase family DNA binding protein